MDNMKKVRIAPRGLANAKASKERLLNFALLVGSERRSELRAKAVGALWSIMARKIMRSKEDFVVETTAAVVVVVSVMWEWA